MKPLHQKMCIAAVTLGLSALAFSELGAASGDGTQSFAAAGDNTTLAPMSEGYFVANGASYFTRNGQAFKVEREVSLRVTPNGMIGFNGQPLILEPGQMLTPDGRHAPIPAGINIRALPGTANPAPQSPPESRVVPESGVQAPSGN